MMNDLPELSFDVTDGHVWTEEMYKDAGPVMGGGGGRGASAPNFFVNFKDLLRKRCFQPPHFESLVSPPPSPISK